MIRGFKATRNAKRYRGRYGSHLQGSQRTKEDKVDVFWGKLHERNFGSWVWRLKSKKQTTTCYLSE